MPMINGKAHWPDCCCLLCAKFSKVCECCNKEFTTFPSYRRHQTAKPKMKRGSKSPPRAAVVPNGLGFLERVLANQEQLQKYNLSVVSRFCAALNDMRPGSYRARFTKAHRRLLTELSESQVNTLLPFKLDLPSEQATAVLKLSQAVNASPNTLLALLVQYGLEHLSKELRENAVAPPLSNPNIKKTLRTERQSAARELLKEQPKVHEYTEYSTPTSKPIPSIRSRFFPTSEKK